MKKGYIAAALAIMLAAVPMQAFAEDDLWGRWENGDERWKDYSDDSVSKVPNSYTEGNLSRLDENEIAAVNAAIEEFKSQHIKPEMSDFEKELQIIQWLVEISEYRCSERLDYTAYGAIINHIAACSGYADAFLQTAKACGLEARYICSDDHAWNLVKLDEDWYHVDVCWEDPVGANDFGFGKLQNYYINLRDVEISAEKEHHRDWNIKDIRAIGTKYDHKAVYEYMKNSVDKESEATAYFDYIKNNERATVIEYTNVDSTANAYVTAIDECFTSGKNQFACAIRYPKEMSAPLIVDANARIKERVIDHVHTQYASRLERDLDLRMDLTQDVNYRYYCYDNIKIFYGSGISDNEMTNNVSNHTRYWKNINREPQFQTPTDLAWVDDDGLSASFKLDPASENRYFLIIYKPDGSEVNRTGKLTESKKTVKVWDVISESGNYTFAVYIPRDKSNFTPISKGIESSVYTYNRPALGFGRVQNIHWGNAEQTLLEWDMPTNFAQVPAEYQGKVSYFVRLYVDGKVKKSGFTTNQHYDIAKWKEKYNDPNSVYTITVQAMSRAIEQVAHGEETRFE